MGEPTLGFSVLTIDKNTYCTKKVNINLTEKNNSKIRQRRVNHGQTPKLLVFSTETNGDHTRDTFRKTATKFVPYPTAVS